MFETRKPVETTLAGVFYDVRVLVNLDWPANSAFSKSRSDRVVEAGRRRSDQEAAAASSISSRSSCAFCGSRTCAVRSASIACAGTAAGVTEAAQPIQVRDVLFREFLVQ